MSLPYKVKATSTENADGGYTVFVNKNLSYELQYQGIKHEIWHIVHDDFNSKHDIEDIESVAHAI